MAVLYDYVAFSRDRVLSARQCSLYFATEEVLRSLAEPQWSTHQCESILCGRTPRRSGKRGVLSISGVPSTRNKRHMIVQRQGFIFLSSAFRPSLSLLVCTTSVRKLTVVVGLGAVCSCGWRGILVHIFKQLPSSPPQRVLTAPQTRQKHVFATL